MGLYPFIFHPIFKERVWGGRKIEELYGKKLPPRVPVGESWEISDRPGDVSVIANGPLTGKDLHWLVEQHWNELSGSDPPVERFPLLMKILDAREKLSLQVHPPAAKAAELGGEPKTEMWYIADAAPGAELYVGLKRGVSRNFFQARLKSGSVADCFHRIAVQAGDAMFLPSGRVHAIGGGLVIFEIQQNSDTTYRVHDWDRAGLDGRPRELHLEQSLASINFDDFEPNLVRKEFHETAGGDLRQLVRHPLFAVELYRLRPEVGHVLERNAMQILAIVAGAARMEANGQDLPLVAGQFCLVPASLPNAKLITGTATTFLRITSQLEFRPL